MTVLVVVAILASIAIAAAVAAVVLAYPAIDHRNGGTIMRQHREPPVLGLDCPPNKAPWLSGYLSDPDMEAQLAEGIDSLLDSDDFSVDAPTTTVRHFVSPNVLLHLDMVGKVDEQEIARLLLVVCGSVVCGYRFAVEDWRGESNLVAEQMLTQARKYCSEPSSR
jgi:hypothetical protein